MTPASFCTLYLTRPDCVPKNPGLRLGGPVGAGGRTICSSTFAPFSYRFPTARQRTSCQTGTASASGATDWQSSEGWGQVPSGESLKGPVGHILKEAAWCGLKATVVLARFKYQGEMAAN